jgi:hypothetical protein
MSISTDPLNFRFCVVLALFTCMASGAQAPTPEVGIILSPHVFWQSIRWPGAAWTQAAAVDDLSGLPRFTVVEPGRRNVWIYPLLSFSYRATGFPEALDANPALAHRRKEQRTPLHLAARFDRADAIDVLADHGANLADLGPGQTPLHEAVQVGALAAARRLLERGADPDIRKSAIQPPCTTPSGRRQTASARSNRCLPSSTCSPNLVLI